MLSPSFTNYTIAIFKVIGLQLFFLYILCASSSQYRLHSSKEICILATMLKFLSSFNESAYSLLYPQSYTLPKRLKSLLINSLPKEIHHYHSQHHGKSHAPRTYRSSLRKPWLTYIAKVLCFDYTDYRKYFTDEGLKHTSEQIQEQSYIIYDIEKIFDHLNPKAKLALWYLTINLLNPTI